MIIENCFLKLLQKIELRDSDKRAYKRHRAGIVSRLKKAFRAHRVEIIGSFKRETAIRDVSDADLMLVLSSQEVARGKTWMSSNTTLKHVRDQLRDRYWQTAVGVDKQAVVINFKDKKHPVDVVPAIYQGLDDKNKFAIYAIPDGAGWWMFTSPQAHNKLIAAADKRSKGKLKQTVKIIKYWRECRRPAIPLNTFHLELLLAKNDACAGKFGLAQCVHKALRLLQQRGCRALTDPLGFANPIPAANTMAKLERLIKAVDAATERAAKARQAEKDGDVKEANRLWNLVFNRSFPKM